VRLSNASFPLEILGIMKIAMGAAVVRVPRGSKDDLSIKTRMMETGLGLLDFV
jgi:hypothetical protein